MLSLRSGGVGVGKELTGEEPDGEGSTDATGAFCGFRISRCSLRVEVCAFFFSKDFVGAAPLVSCLMGTISCWAEAKLG